jgi:hypothetical protein
VTNFMGFSCFLAAAFTSHPCRSLQIDTRWGRELPQPL